MSIANFLRRMHKWIALLVGIQLLLWIISGLVFSFIKHKEVGGNFIFKNQQKDAISQSVDFSSVLKQFPKAHQIDLISLADKSAFKVLVNETTIIVDPESDQSIEISEAIIRQIADASYRGKGQLNQINLVDVRNDENRGMGLPVWQLVYDDDYGSHLYLSAESGEFQGIRTDNWRIFDFFMMLHFMDYGDRGNFNNGLIIFFSLIMFLFSISGMLLVYSSFSINDFTQWVHRFIDHKNVSITVSDRQGNRRKIKVVKDSQLMDVLYDNDIEIDSVCGGGGICGACRVKVISKNKHDHVEDLTNHEALSDQEISQGYRLSCQISVHQALDIELHEDILLANKI